MVVVKRACIILNWNILLLENDEGTERVVTDRFVPVHQIVPNWYDDVGGSSFVQTTSINNTHRKISCDFFVPMEIDRVNVMCRAFQSNTGVDNFKFSTTDMLSAWSEYLESYGKDETLSAIAENPGQFEKQLIYNHRYLKSCKDSELEDNETKVWSDEKKPIPKMDPLWKKLNLNAPA